MKMYAYPVSGCGRSRDIRKERDDVSMRQVRVLSTIPPEHVGFKFLKQQINIFLLFTTFGIYGMQKQPLMWNYRSFLIFEKVVLVVSLSELAGNGWQFSGRCTVSCDNDPSPWNLCFSFDFLCQFWGKKRVGFHDWSTSYSSNTFPSICLWCFLGRLPRLVTSLLTRPVTPVKTLTVW